MFLAMEIRKWDARRQILGLWGVGGLQRHRRCRPLSGGPTSPARLFVEARSQAEHELQFSFPSRSNTKAVNHSSTQRHHCSNLFITPKMLPRDTGKNKGTKETEKKKLYIKKLKEQTKVLRML